MRNKFLRHDANKLVDTRYWRMRDSWVMPLTASQLTGGPELADLNLEQLQGLVMPQSSDSEDCQERIDTCGEVIAELWERHRACGPKDHDKRMKVWQAIGVVTNYKWFWMGAQRESRIWEQRMDGSQR